MGWGEGGVGEKKHEARSIYIYILFFVGCRYTRTVA